MKINLNKQIIIITIILIITILFFQFSNIDFFVSDLFYNFKTHHWILNRQAEPYHFILYVLVKKIIIFFGIVLLILLFTNKLKEYKKNILIAVLSLIFVPLTINTLKKITNMPCPKNLTHYNGKYPHTYLWEHYPKKLKLNKIKCWPAGHASGGFALMSLFFLFRKRKNKLYGLLFGFLLGWIMGIYKMIIGDHFLSHTVISMILSWLIISVIAKIVLKENIYEF